MANSEQIVLYDLPSREPCKCWSLNPWKTRLLLNFKGIDYTTEWTEYPDLKPKLEKHIAPNKEGMAGYTSPTVKFPDGTFVMDSRVIAAEVDKRYPQPPIQIDSPALSKLETILLKLMPTLAPFYIPNVPKRLLNEASHPHWYKTREARVGMPLDQFEREKGGQQIWDAAKPYLDEITAMLKENNGGPYFQGDSVSYVDFVWGGFLLFVQRIGTDFWEKLLQTIGNDADVHSKLVLALDPWSLRNDR